MPRTRREAFRKRSRLVPARGRCFLCGLEGPDTTEHVVPRCIYGTAELPSDIVALPAHRRCNVYTSKDEEAFRNWIAASIPPDNPGHRLWTKTWRSLQRPEAKGLKVAYYKSILARFEDAEASDRSAVPVAVTLADGRIDRVLAKIVKGMFTSGTGQVLPSGGIRWKMGHLKPGGDGGIGLPHEENLHDVVSVKWGQAQDEPSATIWVIGFYDVQFFHITTWPTWRHHARKGKAIIWPGP